MQLQAKEGQGQTATPNAGRTGILPHRLCRHLRLLASKIVRQSISFTSLQFVVLCYASQQTNIPAMCPKCEHVTDERNGMQPGGGGTGDKGDLLRLGIWTEALRKGVLGPAHGLEPVLTSNPGSVGT